MKETFQKAAIETLEFECIVSDGMGMYSELSFPTQSELPSLPDQWAQTMFPGSLNARITSFPEQLEEVDGYGVQKLDSKALEAAALIPHDMIENNALKPNDYNNERGNAQIWPCEVRIGETAKVFNAWAVRRIGSAYSDVIELMSPEKMRDQYDLENGTKLTIKMFSKNHTSNRR